jgi:hypothetical protein
MRTRRKRLRNGDPDAAARRTLWGKILQAIAGRTPGRKFAIGGRGESCGKAGSFAIPAHICAKRLICRESRVSLRA